jgi:Condensation domain
MYRQLGIDERIIWSYDRVRPLHFVMTANIIGTLHLLGLEQALVKVQQRHPLLNVRIELDRSEIPWFGIKTGTIPIRLVERDNPQQWQQEVERELANPFDWHQAPLIRVVLVRGDDASDLIVSCHHSIGDGMSVVFLFRDILQALKSPDLPLPNLSPHPPYEQLIPQSAQKLPSSFEPSLKTTQTQPKLPENSQPRLYSWSLSTAETSAIVHACKQAQTTVHAAICAAFLLAIAQQNQIAAATPLKCCSAVEIRKFLPPIEDDFGVYYMLTNTADPIDPDLSLWELARSIKAQLNQNTAPERIFAHLPDVDALMSTMPSSDDIVNMMEMINGHDLLVSNLGNLTIPQQYGELQLAAVHGPSMTSHVDRELEVGVTTLGTQMSFNLIYAGSDFSVAQIEQLKHTAMQFLKVGIS